MTTTTATPAAAAIQARILDTWPRLSTPKVAQLADTALALAQGDADLAQEAVACIAREAAGAPTEASLRRAVEGVLRSVTVARRLEADRLRREYERQRSEAIDRLRHAVREWVRQAPDAAVIAVADELKARVRDEPFLCELYDRQLARIAPNMDSASRAREILSRTLLFTDLEATLVDRGVLEPSPVLGLDFEAWRAEWAA